MGDGISVGIRGPESPVSARSPTSHQLCRAGRSQLGAPPGCGHFKFLVTEAQRGAGTCLRPPRMSAEPGLGHVAPNSALPPVGFLTSALWCLQGEETKGKQACMPKASYILAETSAARVQPSHFTDAITEAL